MTRLFGTVTPEPDNQTNPPSPRHPPGQLDASQHTPKTTRLTQRGFDMARRRKREAERRTAVTRVIAEVREIGSSGARLERSDSGQKNIVDYFVQHPCGVDDRCAKARKLGVAVRVPPQDRCQLGFRLAKVVRHA